MSALKTRPLTSTESHPKDPVFLHDLAAECFQRHGLSGEKEGLDKLILRLSEKSSLPFAETRSDGTQTLLDLTLARIHRFKTFGELGDVNPTIKHLRNLRQYSLEAFNVPCQAVTISLVEMLATKVKEQVGDALEDIKEIVAFCRGLASGISPVYMTNSLQALTRAALDAYSRGKQLKVIDQAIECLREALESCSPGSHQVKVSFDLSNLLAVRFLVHHGNEYYEEAKLLLDPLTASPGNLPCPYRHQALALKAALEHARSIKSPNARNSDGTISRCRSFLNSCSSFGNPLHPIITELLLLMCPTVQRFDPPQGASAQMAHSNVDPPLFLQLRSFGEVDESDFAQTVTTSSLADVEQEIERLRKHFSRVSNSLLADRQRDCLNKLVHCYRTKVSLTHDITDIKDAIKWHHRLLNLTHPSDSSRSFQLFMLGKYLFMAYNHIPILDDLNESITLHREVLRVEDARLHFATIRRLIGCLSSRLELPGHRSDLDEIMELFALGVEGTTYATVPSRFELACNWASTARISLHHSLPTAYKHAMSLMQSSLVFAPTLPIQHDRLIEKRDLYEKTPLNFASHYIRMPAGNLESAIETLEQGRALLWSEMHGLRTSTDQLRTADSDLAEKFTVINKELEILTTSTWSDESTGVVGGRFKCDKQMVQYPDLMARQQELLKDRDALISQIRDLPGFKNFLLPLSFDALRSAASSSGPVIIINHCQLGSDILIVFHDDPPSRIRTSYDFFDRANNSKVELLTARKKYGPNSENYQKALAFVLSELYELVGRPVIERFNKVGVREKSRVWWCPTSVFGYLPLHAMGPIPSGSRDKRYFCDLYITSYTPTLSALIASRKPDSNTQTPAPPTLLFAQPSPSPPGAWSDEQVIRNLKLKATSLNPGNTSLATVLDGLQRHRFACIAYNGELNTERPFETSIRFFNGGYLTLLDFVRSHHPVGEFALLPGSHTAELTEGSIPDEALHLSAAVQYSGYRSVIGTLWGTDDSVDDGQDLARAVLLSIFSGEERGEPYYERSARALQDAVQQMRRTSNMSLVQWVNYVHYGA